MVNKLTTEIFIQRSNIIHNYKYDYSKSNYISGKNKILIICKEHGEFWQFAGSHLSGKGCDKCARLLNNKKKVLSQEAFLKKAITMHGNKYDYSKSIYIGTCDKVIIICKIHGEFLQTPNQHINGYGCSKCGKSEKLNNEMVLTRFREVHGDRYLYDENFIYKNIDSKIDIICKIHGKFKQSTYSHLKGHNCPKCVNNLPISFEDAILKANKIHKNKYNYSKVDQYNFIYINKVTIICPVHGEFEQRMSLHANGHGCIKCTTQHSNKELYWLDYLNIPEECRGKTIRINNKAYKVDAFTPGTKTIYEFNGDFWHGNPEKFKPEDLNKRNKKTFAELYNKTIEKEKIYKSAGYNVISIWENDFDQILKEIKKKGC